MKIMLNHDKNPDSRLQKRTNYYVLIRGPSYGSLDFDDREAIRTAIREKLESHGIRFREYTWVWDEDDRCLLLIGEYEDIKDAGQCIKEYELLGFKTCIKTSLPGDADI